MADEGAGGLSTAAIEACIAHRAYGWHRPEELAAARAELAALQAAAQRGPALTAALTAARAYLGSLDGRELVGAGRAVRLDARALLRRLDAALDAAGPGAAGARDEAMEALTKVAQIVVDCRDLPAGEFRDKWGVGSWGDYYERLTDLADAALDALRAGGAGEGGGAT